VDRVAAWWTTPGSKPSVREAALIGLLATACSLAFRGFDGGRWSDIPIFKSFADPRLYTRDPFISTLHDGTPAGYTYWAIGRVVALFGSAPIEFPLFVLFVPACVASLALVYALGLHLTESRPASTLYLLLYIAGFRLFTVGSSILHSAELTPAFLALPLQLGAVYALFRGKLATCGALAGLAMNVHAPTSSYVGATIAIAVVLLVWRYGLLGVARVGVPMLALSLPTLAGAIVRHTDALPGWALVLARIELATDLSIAINWDRPALRWRNVAGMLVLAIALWRGPAPRDRMLIGAIAIAVGVLCAIAFVFIDVTLRGPISTLVARLQFPRAMWTINLIGLAIVAGYVVRTWMTIPAARPILVGLVGAMLAAPSDFAPAEPVFLGLAIALVVFELGRTAGLASPVQMGVAWASTATVLGATVLLWTRSRRWWILDLDDGLRVVWMVGLLAIAWGLYALLRPRGRVAIVTALVVALGAAFAVRGSTDWLFAMRHRGGLSAAAEFQEWVRTSTPPDSVFLILPSEPNNDNFYKYAERAHFLVRERANQAVYFTEHNHEFRDRVLALGGTDVLRYREELDPAYRRLTEAQIRELANRFGVTHFVPARSGEFSFPVMYRSGGWTVYEVR
jgi:hypothetical protein